MKAVYRQQPQRSSGNRLVPGRIRCEGTPGQRRLLFVLALMILLIALLVVSG